MDFVSWFLVEAKTFEFQWQMGLLSSGWRVVLFMGKLGTNGLSNAVETLMRNTEAAELIQSFREGFNDFITLRGSNGFGGS